MGKITCSNTIGISIWRRGDKFAVAFLQVLILIMLAESFCFSSNWSVHRKYHNSINRLMYNFDFLTLLPGIFLWESVRNSLMINYQPPSKRNDDSLRLICRFSYQLVENPNNKDSALVIGILCLVYLLSLAIQFNYLNNNVTIYDTPRR